MPAGYILVGIGAVELSTFLQNHSTLRDRQTHWSKVERATKTASFVCSTSNMILQFVLRRREHPVTDRQDTNPRGDF
jgi:hypothetical protein